MNKKEGKNLTGFYFGTAAHEKNSREIFLREASAEKFLT